MSEGWASKAWTSVSSTSHFLFGTNHCLSNIRQLELCLDPVVFVLLDRDGFRCEFHRWASVSMWLVVRFGANLCEWWVPQVWRGGAPRFVVTRQMVIGYPGMCLQSRVSCSQRHLLFLPTELLHEICKCLGTTNILTLRCVQVFSFIWICADSQPRSADNWCKWLGQRLYG